MTEANKAWLTSRQRRICEVGLLSVGSPFLAVAGLGACVALVASDGRDRVIHYAERALYPGDQFVMRKLGDPLSTSRAARLCRMAMLDEIPQLEEVLRNRMSIIGPRALLLATIQARFDALPEGSLKAGWAEARTEQKPGIISSYSLQLHSNELVGIPAEADQPTADADIIARDAVIRATLDTMDYRNASPRYEAGLLKSAAGMVLAAAQHRLGL